MAPPSTSSRARGPTGVTRDSESFSCSWSSLASRSQAGWSLDPARQRPRGRALIFASGRTAMLRPEPSQRRPDRRPPNCLEPHPVRRSRHLRRSRPSSIRRCRAKVGSVLPPDGSQAARRSRLPGTGAIRPTRRPVQRSLGSTRLAPSSRSTPDRSIRLRLRGFLGGRQWFRRLRVRG